MACGASKQKEYDELQAELENLHEQHGRIGQHINNVKLQVEHKKKKNQSAREHAAAEATAQMQQQEAVVAEHGSSLRTFRGHTTVAGHALSMYLAEAGSLAGAGMEPTTSRILVEVWEAVGGFNSLLCEQWIPEKLLLGAAAARELGLVPRLPFSRPAQGKPAFGSAEHLGTIGTAFRLSFGVAALPSPVTAHPDDSRATSDAQELLLTTLKLSAALQDKKGQASTEQPAGKVFLCLWRWGESAIKDHQGSPKTGHASAQVSLEADVATALDVRRSPPPSSPAARSSGSSRRPSASQHSGYWRFSAISIDGLSEEDFALQVRHRPFEEHSVVFKLRPGTEALAFGRQHRTVQALLSHRPDLLTFISRTHVELQAAPDGTSLIVSNIGRNAINVNGKNIIGDNVALMRSGGRLSFMKSDGDGEASDRSVTQDERSVPLAKAQAAGLDRPRTKSDHLHVSFAMQDPILTLELLALPRDAAGAEEESEENDDSEEDEEEDEFEKDEIDADLGRNVAAEALCCESSTCCGYGGDALYRIVEADARVSIYCAACSLSRHVEQPKLGMTMAPQVARPAQWQLSFRSRAVEVTARQKGESGDWGVAFSGQEIRICAPAPSGVLSADELHRQRAAHFAVQRKSVEALANSHAHRRRSSLAESAELEESVRKSAQFSEMHATTVDGITSSVTNLRREASRLTSELRMLEAANQEEQERQLNAAAELQRKMEAEAAELERERQARMKPPDGPLKVLRGLAKHKEPPVGGRCPNGGSLLENHKRLLRVAWEDHGLLYRDARIEIYATVHRPAGLKDRAASQKGSNQIAATLKRGASPNRSATSSPDRFGPSAYHHHPAFAHSLWAEIKITLQARQLSKVQGRLRANTEVTDVGMATDGGFAAVTFECADYDSLEIEYEALPRDSNTEVTPVVEQVLRFELLEFLSCHPSLLVKARLSAGEGLPTPDAGAVVQEHNCQVDLPIFISTFLRPLPASYSFLELWEQPGLVAESKSLPSPLQNPAAKNRHRSPVEFAFHSPFVTPASAMASSEVMKAVLSYGGAFQGFQLPEGTLGLAAELPAHGCVEGAVLVLVSIASAKSHADGDAESEHQNVNSIASGDSMPWTVEARSLEHRLAAAVLAALTSQLLCLPQDAFVLSADNQLSDRQAD